MAPVAARRIISFAPKMGTMTLARSPRQVSALPSRSFLTTSSAGLAAKASGTAPEAKHKPLDPDVRKKYFQGFRMFWGVEEAGPNRDLADDDRFRGVSEEQRPVVLVFGWAGATEKNLAKYMDIYRGAGCTAVGFNLPIDFILYSAEAVPHLAEEMLAQISARGLSRRPFFVHSLSDTGAKSVFFYLSIV